MVILGVILLIIGLVVPAVKILFWIGLVLIIVGLILNFAGPIGASGNRRRYY